MASVEDVSPSVSVYNDPNFGVIWSFIEKFGDMCGLSPDLTITGMQLMLEDTKMVHQDLIDLHVRLLRRSGKKSVPPDKWEKAIVKFCHSYSKVDAWEIERFGYKKSKLSVKLMLMKQLMESQFDGNSKFKTEINKLTADELRLLPIGRDVKGKMYWFHLDRDLNIRIYREDQDDETWEVIVKERDDLVALISHLENHTCPKKEEVTTTPSDTGESKDGEASLSNSLDSKIPGSCDQFSVQESLKKENVGEDKLFIKPEPVDQDSSSKLASIKQEDMRFKIEEETVCCQEDLREAKYDVTLTIKTEPLNDDLKDVNADVSLKSFSNALCHISPGGSKRVIKEMISEKVENCTGSGQSVTVRESVIKLAEKTCTVGELNGGSSVQKPSSVHLSEDKNQNEATDLSVKKEIALADSDPCIQRTEVLISEEALHAPASDKNDTISSACSDIESELKTPQKPLTEITEQSFERKKMPFKKREIPVDFNVAAATSTVDVCDNAHSLLSNSEKKEPESKIKINVECIDKESVAKNLPVAVQEVTNQDSSLRVESCISVESVNLKCTESTSMNSVGDCDVTVGESKTVTNNVGNETVELNENCPELVATDNVAVTEPDKCYDKECEKLVNSNSSSEVSLVGQPISLTQESKFVNDVSNRCLPESGVSTVTATTGAVLMDTSSVNTDKQSDVAEPLEIKCKTLLNEDVGNANSVKCDKNCKDSVEDRNLEQEQSSQQEKQNCISMDRARLTDVENDQSVCESNLSSPDIKSATVEETKIVSEETKIMSEETKIMSEETKIMTEESKILSEETKIMSEETVVNVPIAPLENGAGAIATDLHNSDSVNAEIETPSSKDDSVSENESEQKSIEKSVLLNSDVLSVDSCKQEEIVEQISKETNITTSAVSKENAKKCAETELSTTNECVIDKTVPVEPLSGTVACEDSISVEDDKTSAPSDDVDHSHKTDLGSNKNNAMDVDTEQSVIKTEEATVDPNVPKEEETVNLCETTESVTEDANASVPSEQLETTPTPKKRRRGRGELSKLGPIEILPVKRSPRLQAQRIKYEDEQRKIETELQKQALLRQQRLNEERKQKRETKDAENETVIAVANGNGIKKRGRPKKIVEEKEIVIKMLKKKRSKKRKSKLKQKKKKSIVVTRKKKKSNNPWDVSSESSYCSSSEAGGKAAEEEEEEEEEDEELVFNDRSDHEFSPESEADEPNSQPTTIRRARTVKNEKTEVATDESSSEGDDKPCTKCDKRDHPEWILLCDKCDSGYHTSCLRPPLMVIPDGDWFCPPCCHVMLLEKLHEQLKSFDQLWKKKDREEMRKKRLAYVGISLDNVLKPEKEQKESCEEEEDEDEEDVEEEVKEYVLLRKRSRRARKEVSYRFKEFDELIKSAIDEPSSISLSKGQTGLGKGKDMSTIKYSDEIEEDQEKENKEDVEDNAENEIPSLHSSKKRKHKRLNDLDTSSSEQDDDSDEDFRGNSSNSEPSDDDSYGAAEDSEESWSEGRSSRFRTKSSRYDRDFVDDNSDDSYDSCRRKGRRAAAKTVNYREVSESDEDYGNSRRKAKNYSKPYREPQESDNDSDWKKPSKRSRFDFPEKSTKRSGKMWRLESDEDESDDDDEGDDDVRPTKTFQRGSATKRPVSDSKYAREAKKRMNVNDFVKKSEDESSSEDESNSESSDDDKDDSESDDNASTNNVKNKITEGIKAEGEITDNNREEIGGVIKKNVTSPSEVMDESKSESASVLIQRDGTDLEAKKTATNLESMDIETSRDTGNESSSENALDEGVKTSDMASQDGSIDLSSKIESNVAASNKSSSSLHNASKNLSDVDIESNPKSKVDESLQEKSKQNSSEEFQERPTPLHPSTVEPFSIRSSPSKLTLLDNFSSRSSPQNKLTALELYPPSPSTSVIPPFDRDRPPRPHGPSLPHSHLPPPVHPHQYHGEFGNYPGQYYPPYPPHGSQYSSPQSIGGYQSPGNYPPYQQPSPNYGYVPQAYNEQGLYQGQPPHYGPPYPNYSPPPPPPVQVPVQSGSNSQGQSNGRFSIDNLLQRRMEGGEDDEFSSVNELVSYITGSHENPL